MRGGGKGCGGKKKKEKRGACNAARFGGPERFRSSAMGVPSGPLASKKGEKERFRGKKRKNRGNEEWPISRLPSEPDSPYR